VYNEDMTQDEIYELLCDHDGFETEEDDEHFYS